MEKVYSKLKKNDANIISEANPVWIYVAKISERIDEKPVYPKERKEEIEGCGHARVRVEKYTVWRLLEYALAHSFGYKMQEVNFYKEKNGKWTCDKCYFSLSHSDGMALVAISKQPIGVDVETLENEKIESMATKILTDEEKIVFQSVSKESRRRFLTETWTKKESFFKRRAKDASCPKIFSQSKRTLARYFFAEENIFYPFAARGLKVCAYLKILLYNIIHG